MIILYGMPRSGSSYTLDLVHRLNNNIKLGEYFNPNVPWELKGETLIKGQYDSFSRQSFNDKLDMLGNPHNYTIKILPHHLKRSKSFIEKFNDMTFWILVRSDVQRMFLSWAIAKYTNHRYLHNTPSDKQIELNRYNVTYDDLSEWYEIYKMYLMDRVWLLTTFDCQIVHYENLKHESIYKKIDVDYEKHIENIDIVKEYMNDVVESQHQRLRNHNRFQPFER